MCVNLGKFEFLVNPLAIVRKAAEGMGLDATTATILTGDFFGHKQAVEEEEKKKDKETRANNEAWQRYYASREAVRKNTSVLSSSNETGTNTGGFTL